VVISSTRTYTRFIGEDGITYHFEARARDRAGNVSDYTSAQYAVSVCPVAADAYENDDTFNLATSITPGIGWQTHNFHADADQDWLQFSGVASATYVLETHNTGGHADTVLTVYDSDGTTVLAANDDAPDDWPASWLRWTAPHTGTFYAQVTHWDPYAYGCTTTYTLRIRPALRTSGDWQQTGEGGFGARRIEYITALGTYNNHLYAGALNRTDYAGLSTAGAQLWRTGSPWQAVTTDGFGYPYNVAIDHLLEFKGQLYAGTWADETNGGEIWRTGDEIT